LVAAGSVDGNLIIIVTVIRYYGVVRFITTGRYDEKSAQAPLFVDALIDCQGVVLDPRLEDRVQSGNLGLVAGLIAMPGSNVEPWQVLGHPPTEPMLPGRGGTRRAAGGWKISHGHAGVNKKFRAITQGSLLVCLAVSVYILAPSFEKYWLQVLKSRSPARAERLQRGEP
jgi:hypothetical protein